MDCTVTETTTINNKNNIGNINVASFDKSNFSYVQFTNKKRCITIIWNSASAVLPFA